MSDAYSSTRRGQIEATAPSFDANALVAVGVIVSGLYFARDVLVPFVIAVLLSFVLAGPAKWLQNLGLGRRLPVAAVVLAAFLVLSGILTVLTSQVAELATDLPRYQTTIREKISALKGAASGQGIIGQLADMLQSLAEDARTRPRPSGATPTEAPAGKPVQVEIVNAPSSPFTTVAGLVSPILHPLASAGLTGIFTIFILLTRSDLRNRAIRLAGSHDLQRTTAAMNDAASRLSRFFLVQVLLNASFGILVGIGLWMIGVPSPILWGIMAALSRFVPYVGVVLAAGGPLVLAAAVDPSWTMLAATAAFFAATEFVVGQVVEPLVYGHSTGLSPVAVIAAVTFWTWLWGPVGLILSTPLTVCLVVLGRHVDRLEFLDVMLGDRPALTAAESFYQRALAGDAGEAIEQAELFLRDHDLVTFYDEVALRGLALAQLDLARGALDATRLDRIRTTVSELIEDVATQDNSLQDVDFDANEASVEADLDGADFVLREADRMAACLPSLGDGPQADAWHSPVAILCIAGRNELDRAGAMMLAQVLTRQGFGVRVEDADVLTATGSGRLAGAASRIVCLSYLDTTTPVHVRYAVRRVRRRLPHARIVVGAWSIEAGGSRSLCEAVKADACATRLIEVANLCLEDARAVPLATDPQSLTAGPAGALAGPPSPDASGAAPPVERDVPLRTVPAASR